MTGNFIFRFSLIALVFIIGQLSVRANDRKPYQKFHLNGNMMTRSLTDTLPDNKKTASENTDKKQAEELIKEVPKSHKQVKPIAVPATGIKPIQVIKPKIIKPILKPILKPIIKIN